MPTLFVFSHPIPAGQAEEIADEVRRLSPRRQTAFVNPPASEIARRNWRGNDDVWRDLLADVAVTPGLEIGPLLPLVRTQMRRAARHLKSWARRT